MQRLVCQTRHITALRRVVVVKAQEHSQALFKFTRSRITTASHPSIRMSSRSQGGGSVFSQDRIHVNDAAVGRVVKGAVFDMDGTLTVPCIDFAEMRRRVGIEQGDILHVIHSWPEDKQKEAFAKIAEIEEEALANLKVMPGAIELCSLLDEAMLPRALVTRNVSSSVQFFHDTAFPLPPFHPSLSREWKPYKPDPASLHYIADHWGVEPHELVMIGDSAKDDVVCGNAAGALTILLDQEGVYSGRDDVALKNARPDFIVRSMHEVSVVLHTMVKLQGKE